ncbi:DNRLRE domain-containing protein [Paenibacillus naphthalenovorans]|uniref:DNRLRE domain-containing protein n=1 Tax=Paenibacillus naphthalenovorans TaxID=162209 RepID=UPI000783F41E|nr:DNRLRE domain-containing protein [Paenibacillus naphthalenovorans]
MSDDFIDISGRIIIPPHNKMTGKLNIIAVGKEDIVSSITVTRYNEIPSLIYVYSDYVVERIAYPPRLGNQRRANLRILNRSNILGNIKINPKNKMTGRTEIVQPPKTIAQLYPVKDAFVREGVKTLNYGIEQTMLVGYNRNLNERYRSFLEFDLSQLPENITIEKAELKVFNLNKESVNHQVGLFSAASTWTEQGVTWNSQPAIQNILDSKNINETEGYISFEVTNKVSNWCDGTEVNYGFILKSLNESIQQYGQFYTRESQINKPILEITYREKIIYSAGRTEIDGNIFVKSIGQKDLSSSIRIQEYDQKATLRSSIHIYNPDYMESSILVNRPKIEANIQVRRSDESDLLSNLIVRQKWLDQRDASILVNAPSRVGHINIPYRSDLPSDLNVRQKKSDYRDASILVNAPYRVGHINIPYRISLPSSVTVRALGCEKFPAKISIIRKEILGNLTVKRRDFSEINGSIAVKRSDFDEIDSSISVIRKEIPSSIMVVLSDYLPGSITVQQTDESTIPSYITIPYRKDLHGSINVVGASMISGNIFVISGFLRASISIPEYASYDILGQMKVRAKWISEIPSSLTVGGDNIPGGFVFII